MLFRSMWCVWSTFIYPTHDDRTSLHIGDASIIFLTLQVPAGLKKILRLFPCEPRPLKVEETGWHIELFEFVVYICRFGPMSRLLRALTYVDE